MSDPLCRIDWPVRTERLLLRRATPDDLEATWAMHAIPGVGEWLTASAPDLDTYRQRWNDERVASTVLVERVDDPGTVIAEVRIGVADGWAQAEIAEGAVQCEAGLGWVLHPDHAGKGYATEAVRAALSVCFDGLGLRRVHAGCFVANEPSWRLMERVGMRREAHNVRDGLHRSGEWMDGYLYALLAEEWVALQA